MIKSKELARVLYELAREDTPDLWEKFSGFIKAKNLASQMPSVLYHFEKIVEAESEKRGVKIEVPHEVSGSTIQDIKEFLKAENLEETIEINKSLLAGFRARKAGVLHDFSFATALGKLKEQIISA
jgi:F0F1-type ATP synthase delta subunit